MTTPTLFVVEALPCSQTVACWQTWTPCGGCLGNRFRAITDEHTVVRRIDAWDASSIDRQHLFTSKGES